MTVRATMHGGPHDGETIEMPWARIEIPFLRVDEVSSEGLPVDVYRLRGPWRGQDTAHFLYVEPEPAGPARKTGLRHRLARWLWLRWG